MTLVLLLLVTTVVIFLATNYLKNRRFYALVGKLPSPPGLPILGHAKIFKSSEEFLPTLTKIVDDYDGMAFMRLGPVVKYLVVADPELIELLVNSKHVRKSPRYRIFERWLGVGMFTLEGEMWKKHRSLITPAFHLNILEQNVDIFNKVTDIFVKNLKKNMGKTIDIYPYMNLCALDVIAEAAMGVSVNAQEDSESKYMRSLHDVLTVIERRLFSFVKQIDWIYCWTQDFQKEEEAIAVLKENTNSIIEKRQKQLLVSNGVARSTSVNREKKRRLALLDLLLEIREKDLLSDTDISNAVEGAMFAGHDTGASAISCVIYLLSQHLDVQQRAFEELRDIFGKDKQRPCTYKDLQEMRYVEMVIKESLRLYPPAPIISKLLLEDIEYNGYILPKGLVPLISIHSVHRREKYFPNPDIFDPERFTPENQAKIETYAYLPFGAGPRICIGQKFAMLEMKVMVAKILRNYELLPVDDFKMKLIPQIVQKPRDGIQIRLRNREYL